MATDPAAGIVDFDPEAVLEAAREAAGADRVLTCVVYDQEAFRTIYVHERVDALYPDEDAREEHFGRIHSYVHLDFTEQELFGELFMQPDGIRAFVTYTDELVAVRVVVDRQGVFLSLAPDAPVTDVVCAVEGAIGE